MSWFQRLNLIHSNKTALAKNKTLTNGCRNKSTVVEAVDERKPTIVFLKQAQPTMRGKQLMQQAIFDPWYCKKKINDPVHLLYCSFIVIRIANKNRTSVMQATTKESRMMGYCVEHPLQ